MIAQTISHYRILEKDRALRYQSAEEVIQELQAVRKEVEVTALAGKTKAVAVLPFDNISPDDAALTASQKAVEMDPNNFTGQWILGRIYLGMDRDREAVELFKKVQALNPELYSVYSDLQIAYGPPYFRIFPVLDQRVRVKKFRATEPYSLA